MRNESCRIRSGSRARPQRYLPPRISSLDDTGFEDETTFIVGLNQKKPIEFNEAAQADDPADLLSEQVSECKASEGI